MRDYRDFCQFSAIQKEPLNWLAMSNFFKLSINTEIFQVDRQPYFLYWVL